MLRIYSIFVTFFWSIINFNKWTFNAYIGISDEFDIITSSKKELVTLNKLGENIEKQEDQLEELKEGSTSINNKQASFKILDFNDNLSDQRQDKDSSRLVLSNSENENDSISYLKKLFKPSHTSNPEKFK